MQALGRPGRSIGIRNSLFTIIIALIVGAVIFLLWDVIDPRNPKVQTNGNIHSSWSKSSVAAGETVELSIDITPESAVDTVMALVEFDPDELAYRSVSYESTAFLTQIPATVHKSSVRVQAAIMGGGTVDKESHVATLTFEAVNDSRLEATITGGSARAGTALNPTVSGEPPKLEGADKSWPVRRLAYSLIGGFGLVAIAWSALWFIKYRRKGKV